MNGNFISGPLAIDLGFYQSEGLKPVSILTSMINRHGLIAGATGTGKTVTLRVLAENLSKAGVPVFMADVKGDLSGLAVAAQPNEKITERVTKLGITNYQPRPFPTIFWDLYGEKGIPLRTTITEVGPILLSRILELNDVQSGVLNIAFEIADEQSLPLVDIKDLRALLGWMVEQGDQIQSKYGAVAKSSVAAIQRSILSLEQAGGETFFGEPALNLEHLMQCDFSGQGVVNILDAQRLMQNPRLYTSFLLWLLSELFEKLPEVGDVQRPKLAFFFDEAHLLFDSAPPSLIERVEQVVRLIRSKGVGIYFISQNPLDIPDTVLSQLGNRVQHALRAFTPRDQKAVRSAAETFRSNSELNTAEVISQLGVGEALVSCLDKDGVPTVVQRTMIVPPESRLSPLSDSERSDLLSRSPIRALYSQAVDRESAFEMIRDRMIANAKQSESNSEAVEAPKKGAKREGVWEAFFKSAARSIGSQIGRQISRGIFGSLTR